MDFNFVQYPRITALLFHVTLNTFFCNNNEDDADDDDDDDDDVVSDVVICRGGTLLTVVGQDLDISISPLLHVTTTSQTGDKWNIETTNYQAVSSTQRSVI